MVSTPSNPNSTVESEESFPIAFPIVGIGASAGGIEACSTLLRELPEKTGIAYVVVQHLGSNSPSMLSRILGRETAVPVAEAQHDAVVEPDQIYVIPPNKRMTIDQGRLQLVPRQESDRPFMSIDIFFKSLAKDCQNRAIGVVLSGLDGDGAEGLKYIKQAGGIAFAQTQSTAEYSEMPISAADTGVVDFILPPGEIARQLVEVAQHPYVSEPDSFQIQASEADHEAGSESDLLPLYALLKTTTGIDFNQYKRATFERRLKRRMALYRLNSLEAYLEHLRNNPTEINALCRDALITVTSFFRDAGTFEFLKETIYPSLIEQKGLDASIRIWVAGCATGEECYSLAISLFEFLSEENVNLSIQIFGTDVNEEAIDVARRGMYPANKMGGVSAERRSRFFTYTEEHYQVSKAVRELCIFARQNLGSDPPFSNIDLISCRNVMIYFAPALQKRVRAIFHYSLRPGGFLLLGSSESVSETSELFSVVDAKHRIYAQNTAANRLNFDFVTSDYTALHPQTSAEGASVQNPNYSNVQRQADQIVLSRYAPVGVVVNDRLDILHFRGNTSPYLRPAPGEPSFNLLKMVQPSLIVELRSVIEQAKVRNATARKEGLQIENNPRYIQIEVTPIKNPLSRERNYLVLFEEGALIGQEPASSGTSQDSAEKAVTQVNPIVARLEQELAAVKQELVDTQAYLQATIEEHDATNQRLTTANEEILSSNEELQSTNEELQTAKEEIQAANEELKTTNEELQNRNDDARASNDDLLNLLNNVKIPVVMLSSDMRIRRFTPSAQQLFNLIPSDLGRPISDIRVDIDLPEFEALIAEVISTLDVQEREVQSSNGRWYQLRIRPYRTADNVIDGAVVALIDINDIKQTQRQLEMSHLYAERIIETVRESLVVLGENLKVRSANRAFYQTFQLSADDTEGRSLFELSNGQWNIPELQTGLIHLLNDGTEVQDLEIDCDVDSTGRKTMLLNARRIEQIAEGQMILLAIEDITERKQAEAEHIELAEAQAARREAEVANTSKDEFLSVLSHELRTPLNAILGWTNILMKSPSDPTLLHRALGSIERSTRTQTRIVEDLLEVSRIIQGQVELRQASVDLSDLISSVVESMLPAAEKANVQLAATIGDSPGYFYFDPDRLRQIFSNGLSNAIKFTPPGGQVNTQLIYSGHQAQVRITDTGEGIAPEFLPRVFDRFRQENSSNTRQYGGLGLGLAIVKTFVEAHDGTVHISSPGVGAGTTLTITLPLIEAIPPIATAAPLPDGDDLLTGLRILIVEDNIDNLEILVMMLEVQGAVVIPATSVAEAMDKLVEEDVIDLLLSDISLPGEDGFDLIRQIRASDEYRELPAIAITGYAGINDTESIFHAGFQHHLTKPVELDELMAAILDLVA